MKKFANYILVAAAAFAALSCNKEVSPEAPAACEGVIVFKATLDQPTKAGLDAYKVVWEEGDVIAVKSGDTWANSTPITDADIEDGGRTATFSVSIASASSYTLVYPASAVSDTDLPEGSAAGSVMLALPVNQVIPAGGNVDPAALIQIGTSTESNKVSFKNAVSLVEIQVPESGIDAMYIQATNPDGAELKITGEAVVAPDPAVAASSNSKPTIILSGSFTSGQTYFAAVWPQATVGSVRLGFSKGSGSSMQKASRTGTSASGFDFPVSGGRKFENLGSLSWFDGTIKTKADLDKWASIASFYSAGETVKLGADINYEGGTWTPVSGNENSGHFAGTFDGAGHCIYNIVLGTTSEYGGFFSIVASPDVRTRVKDLTLGKAEDGSSLVVSSSKVLYAGALAARIKNTQISNVKNYIPVTVEDAAGGHWVGGILGQVMSGSENSITNCQNYADVTMNGETAGNNYYGGVVGLISGKTAVKDCTNSGKISRNKTSSNKGVNTLGGITGRTGNTLSGVTITNCTNSGTIETTVNVKAGQIYLGGIIGMDGSPAADDPSRNMVVSNCSNTGDVNCYNQSGANGDACGGIIGRISNDALISECTNLGAITKTGNHSVEACFGGIAGMVSGEDGLIDACVNGKSGSETAGAVCDIVQSSNTNMRHGGIVGYMQRGTCTNSINYGSVTSYSSVGKMYLGGLAGNSTMGSFTACSSYGTITLTAETPVATHSAGGLIGLQNNNASAVDIFTGEDCFVSASVSSSYAGSAGAVIGRYSNTSTTSCWGSETKPIKVSSACTVNNVAVTSSNFGTSIAGSDYGITASGVASGLNTIWAVLQ